MLFSIPKSTPWTELPHDNRGAGLLFELYDDVPANHVSQISRIDPDSVADLDEWYHRVLPRSESRDSLGFPESRIRILDDSSWNTEVGIQEVRQWIHNLGIPYDTTTYLFYDRPVILRMPWRLVVKYWTAWAWSVGYAMTAVDSSGQWACMFHHENVIQFGCYNRKQTEQNVGPKPPTVRFEF
jgi:hypothetical protein